MAGLGVPVYDVIESGPDHAKTFQATVNIDDQSYGPGAGRNKKEAEQNAAAMAFAALKGSRGSGPLRTTDRPSARASRGRSRTARSCRAACRPPDRSSTRTPSAAAIGFRRFFLLKSAYFYIYLGRCCCSTRDRLWRNAGSREQQTGVLGDGLRLRRNVDLPTLQAPENRCDCRIDERNSSERK